MKRLTYHVALGTLVLFSLTALAVLPARAQDDEPETGVARISVIRGDVLLTRGDSGDQVQTSVNSPLVRGDRITTGDKSQTEIQLDHSNIIRLAPGSEVHIADLTRSVIQIQVARGLVNYTVLKTNEAEIEIDTPNMAVRPIKEGAYRIQVTSPTETQLIVRKGDADVTTPQGTARVEDGRIITVRGAESPEYQIAKAPGRDDWDKWNNERDSTIKDAKSYKYANHYYTGSQDLDRNGRWVYMPDYGDYAWTPYVNAGWAPYSSGYWGWQPYWGWTWISYEPWGWAPYHYGRWFHHGSSWYWWPGRHHYGYYPAWGPAYVSFIGFGFGGHNWNFGFGYGYNSIGWLALGPYDHCYSWWGRHNSFNAVNITNITNITNVTNINRGGRGNDQFGRGSSRSNLEAALSNGNVRNGITRVSSDDFVRGNFSRGQRGLDANSLREGQLVQGRIPAAPTRESLRPVNGNSRASAGSGSDRFFSRRQAPTISRNFNDEAASVENMMRNNPFDAAGGRATDPSSRAAAPGSATTSRGANSVATRTPENTGGRSGSIASRGAESTNPASRPGANAAGSTSIDVRGGEQTGWRRFGGAPQGRGVETRGSAAATSRTEFAQGSAQGTRPSGQSAQPSGQSAQPAPQQDRNWRRFGTGQARVDPNRPTTTGSTPGTQAAPGRSAQEPQGAPSRTSRGVRGSEAAPARIEGGSTAPQRGESSNAPSGGWRRFGSRSDNSGSAERPALGIRKPITTERAAPRTFERSLSGGSQATGTGSAPATSRSFEGGGQPTPRSFERGGGGAPQGGREATAPSSAPRSFQGSSGRAAPSGGGSAAPRSFERSGGSYGGSTARSAPSAPSRSYGGGGAARSAPSRSNGGGGGGGSSRGWSAPSGGGGGRGASAPSGGGGRSAPSSGGGRSSGSSSRGGGSRGQR